MMKLKKDYFSLRKVLRCLIFFILNRLSSAEMPPIPVFLHT